MFDPDTYGISEEQKKIRNNITSITVPDGYISIGWHAFESKSITDVYLPSSVKNIGYDAFGYKSKITIHAPAGSYAETYAKENNIAFMAE